ncbi:hypothetical protein GOV11_01830 [Candidatus Woesearchaeota archaeon]|nr:hypothetical protein [Candidatus Woesearchaeota archaeon]
MNETRLKAMGWTKKEIDHARKIFAKAEKNHPGTVSLQRAVFWLTVIVLASGVLAFVIELLPVILLGGTLLGAVMLFVIGSCLGLLFVHVAHDLPLGAHHHVGAVLLILAGCGIVFMLMVLMQAPFSTYGVKANPAILSAGLGIGLAIPYIAHWRVTRAAK